MNKCVELGLNKCAKCFFNTKCLVDLYKSLVVDMNDNDLKDLFIRVAADHPFTIYLNAAIKEYYPHKIDIFNKIIILK